MKMAKNYIKTLQDRVAELEAEKQSARETLIELETYLLSTKFHCGDELDGYVSIQDVLARMRDAQNMLIG
jgi:hypothetical protein